MIIQVESLKFVLPNSISASILANFSRRKDMMSFSKPWHDVVETPFKAKAVTEETKAISQRMASRMRGNVRISTGRIYTSSDMVARRSSAKLP
jgi:hypothetical protein